MSEGVRERDEGRESERASERERDGGSESESMR